MKTTIVALIALTFCDIALGQKPHRRECNETLARFDFSDQHGGCDEAIDGRWFLHFEPEGSIKIGLWSADSSRKLKYHFDDENAPHVDLDDIFGKKPKWRRIGTHTIEIKNTKDTHLFTIIPNYDAGSPSASANFISFYEVGGKGRVFVIGFVPHYKDQFKSSKEFR